VRSESSLSYRSKILIESDDEINFVNFDDIIYIMSNNAITCVITNKEKHNTKETLKEYEKKLPNDKFLRVHKSYIVSIDHIRKVLKNYLGSTSLMMDNDEIIPVGRIYKDNLKKYCNECNYNALYHSGMIFTMPLPIPFPYLYQNKTPHYRPNLHQKASHILN